MKDFDRIPSMQSNPNGLHERYKVTKSNGEVVDIGAIYFVLRLDPNGSDLDHVWACQEAALTYANTIEDLKPILAHELRALVAAQRGLLIARETLYPNIASRSNAD